MFWRSIKCGFAGLMIHVRSIREENLVNTHSLFTSLHCKQNQVRVAPWNYRSNGCALQKSDLESISREPRLQVEFPRPTKSLAISWIYSRKSVFSVGDWVPHGCTKIQTHAVGDSMFLSIGFYWCRILSLYSRLRFQEFSTYTFADSSVVVFLWNQAHCSSSTALRRVTWTTDYVESSFKFWASEAFSK